MIWNFVRKQISMIKCRCCSYFCYLCLTYIFSISSQCHAFVSDFRKRKEVIWHCDFSISFFYIFFHKENRLTGAGSYAHSTADTFFVRIDCRKRCDIFSDPDAAFFAGILAWVAGNILRTLDDRMNSFLMCHAWKSLDLIICHISFVQKVHGDVDAFLCFFNELSSVLWGKHSLTHSIKLAFQFINPCISFFLCHVSKITCNGCTGHSSLDPSGPCVFNP